MSELIAFIERHPWECVFAFYFACISYRDRGR